MKDKKPELSIIIPTLNEEQYLPKLLESIKIQTYKNYEIIVSDSNSEDKTVDVAESFGAKIVNDEKKGPGHGRNEGVKLAEGKYLLFLDADVILPTANFLKKYMRDIKVNNIELGHCFIFLYPFYIRDMICNFAVNLYFKIKEHTDPQAGGYFIFVSKELFDYVNGFDNSKILGEDKDFIRRASNFFDFHILNYFVYLSNRRMIKEGRYNFYKKYLYLEFKSKLPHFLSKIKVNYEFGNYKMPCNDEVKYIYLMKKINEFFEQNKEHLLSSFENSFDKFKNMKTKRSLTFIRKKR